MTEPDIIIDPESDDDEKSERKDSLDVQEEGTLKIETNVKTSSVGLLIQ